MHSEQVLNLLTKEYTLLLATTPNHLKAVKEIRETVFSSKYSMSPETLNKIGFIFNEDDKQSFIYLLRDNFTKKYIGTVRIFFLNKDTPSKIIPMQKDAQVKDIGYLTKELPICEVSRLALCNNLTEHKYFSTLQLRAYLSLLLMITTRVNFFLYHYKKIFAFMEPALQRILKRQGVIFESVGSGIDNYGVRFPFVIKKEDFLVAGSKTEDAMGQITRYYLKELCKNPESLLQFIDKNPYLKRSDIQLDRICKLFIEYGDNVDLELLLKDK